MAILSRRTLAAILLLFTAAAPTRAEGRAVAFAHVTVIDTVTGTTRPDFTVVVEGNRIEGVGPSGEVRIPPDAKVVDASGKFLSPGLWDMHIHTFFGDWVPGGREVTLPLFVANGITGARDMGSDLDPILAARRDVETGKQVGPRLFVSGPMLDGPKSQFPAALKIATPEDGRSAVAMLKRAASISSRSSRTFRARPTSRSRTNAASRESRSPATSPMRSAPPRPPTPVRRASST